MPEGITNVDVMTLVKDIVVLIATNLNKQMEKNIVLTNGNNNEVQIPNEAGPGGNVQV